MTIPEAKRNEFIKSTHEIAWSLVEDLEHMREIVGKKNVTSAELRRLSNQLRRMLIDNDGDLRKVAPPRLMRRLCIMNFNSEDFIEENKDKNLSFVALGFSGIFGVQQEAIIISASTAYADPEITYLNPWTRETRVAMDPRGLNTDRPPASSSNQQVTRINQYGFRGPKRQMIGSSLDDFLSSSVMYFEKKWIERRDVIKYVANVAGGVHSGQHSRPVELALQEIRQIGSFKPVDGQPSFTFNIGTIMPNHPKPIDVDRDGVDFVLVQLMAAARYIVISPDIVELEKLIRNEKIS